MKNKEDVYIVRKIWSKIWAIEIHARITYFVVIIISVIDKLVFIRISIPVNAIV